MKKKAQGSVSLHGEHNKLVDEDKIFDIEKKYTEIDQAGSVLKIIQYFNRALETMEYLLR